MPTVRELQEITARNTVTLLLDMVKDAPDVYLGMRALSEFIVEGLALRTDDIETNPLSGFEAGLIFIIVEMFQQLEQLRIEGSK